MKEFKPLGDSLGPLLKDLERRAQATHDLTARVRAALPSPEKEHVIAASCREETLVLSMDSAAWCSRVRYHQSALIEALHTQGETHVTKLKVRVGRAETS